MSDPKLPEARCLCGQVRLKFLRPGPVLHVHCCCADCRQAMEWVASTGGPPMIRAVTQVYYFENDLADPGPQALSLLYVVKLRENGRTRRLITRCCHSVLATDHPFYDGNVFSAHSDLCDLDAPRIPPHSRIFTNDWDRDTDGEMPRDTAALEDTEAKWEAFAAIVKRPVRGPNGLTLQDIFARLPPPEILGLAENQRLQPIRRT